MALLALIAACEPLPGGTLRALASVAAETLIERQATRLSEIGVTRIFVAVEAVPADLLAAFDRMRQRGLAVHPVRSAADLLRGIDSGDRILLVADGLQAGKAYYQALASAPVPTLLVTDDTLLTAGFERIDAGARWGGLAVVTDAMVAELADLPGEWDMVLTLLRFAVQGGAARLHCQPALYDQGDIAIIADANSAALLEQASLQQVEYGGMGMGRSLVTMPVIRLVGPWLVRSTGAARALPYATALMWLVAAAFAAFGLPVAVAVTSVLGCFGIAALRFMSAFRADGRRQDLARAALRHVSLALLAALPWLLALGGTGGRFAMPPFDLSALALCLAATIMLARSVYEAAGEGRRYSWLIPDSDQAWLMLAPALCFGFVPLMFAILPLQSLLQTLLWLRFSRLERPEADRV